MCNFWTVFSLLFIVASSLSLKLIDLKVPAFVTLKTRAELTCRWKLGPTDVLYSVKWYKDGREFFRHVPRDVEPRRKFPLPGVDVEEHDFAGSNITLAPAVMETGGRYRCEVSGERPLFPTVSYHADMVIVVPPVHGPVISGFGSRYRIGDHVTALCTSGRSYPAVQLSWYINGEAASSILISQPVIREDEEGLYTSSVELKFDVTEELVGGRGLKVKCLATIGSVYWKSNEESAFQAKQTVYNGVELIYEDARIAVPDNSSVKIVSSAGLSLNLVCCFLLLRILLNSIF